MSISITRSNGEVLWFDAVTDFAENYSSNVSSNPVPRSGAINDNVTTENPKISFSGVISNADFHLSRPIITEEVAQEIGTTSASFLSTDTVGVTFVTTNQGSSLAKYLPETLAQFLPPDAPPTITMQGDRSGSSIIKTAEAFLSALVRGKLIAIPGGRGYLRNSYEVFTLTLWQDGKPLKVFKDCVLTGLNYRENPDSGDAIYPQISITQVTFVPTLETILPQNVIAALRAAATTESSRGSTTPEASGESEELSDKDEPSNYQSILRSTQSFSRERGIAGSYDVMSRVFGP